MKLSYLIRGLPGHPLPVGKVGFSAQLAGWADSEGPLYGLGAIIMALFVGWLGGAVMRRI